MLSKKQRRTTQDFKGLRPKIIFRGNVLDIAYKEGLEHKYACVISKKQIKKAVLRNKVKRKVYSVIASASPKKPGFYIIYPKTKAETTPYKEIFSELASGFATLK